MTRVSRFDRDGGRRLVAAVTVLFQSNRTRLFRTGIFMTIAATTIASLVLTSPAQRHYDEADLVYGRYDYQIAGSFSAEDLARLEKLATPDSFLPLISVGTSILAHGREVGAIIYLTTEARRLGSVSWFSTATRVAGPGEAPSGSWLDVSAAIAQRLGVSPGEQVCVDVEPRPYCAPVRNVHAMAHVFPIAAGPLTREIRAFLPAGLTATSVLLRSTRSPGELRAAAPNASVESRLDALATRRLGGGDPGDSATAVLTVLGLGCLGGLALREAVLLIRRRHRELAVLRAIGLTRLRVSGFMVGLYFVVVFIALVVADLVVRRVSFGSVFQPAFPPQLLPALRFGLAGGLLAYTLGLAAGLRRFTSSRRVIASLQSERAL